MRKDDPTTVRVDVNGLYAGTRVCYRYIVTVDDIDGLISAEESAFYCDGFRRVRNCGPWLVYLEEPSGDWLLISCRCASDIDLQDEEQSDLDYAKDVEQRRYTLADGSFFWSTHLDPMTALTQYVYNSGK